MVKKYADLYLDTRRRLLKTEDPDRASMIARELLRAATGQGQEYLLAHRDLFASEEICEKMEEGTERAVSGEPLPYILGEWDFFGMTLCVTPDVLIPRDDTCAVTELAIEAALKLEQDPRVLDLCTGSGCIGLAVAKHVKDARVTLADLSREALAVAKKNAGLHKMTGRVSCIQVDAMKEPPAFLGSFDLIVSNPPYVTEQEMEELDKSVRDYEPHMALDGGKDGLDFYRAIISHYRKILKANGFMALEFGMGQGDDVCSLLEQAGFQILERRKDFGGIERAVIAQLTREEE